MRKFVYIIMNRGRRSHVHVTQLFEEPPLQLPTSFVHTRGRDTALLHSRNQKLVHRYYYKAKLHRLQYETLLEELSTEFDISKKTIYNILFIDCYDMVSNIMQAKPNIKDLRKLYPFYNWVMPLA